MNFVDLFDNVVMTEKSSRFTDDGSGGVVFYSSAPKATKIQVRFAIERFFKGVQVKSVNSLNVKPVSRKFKGKVGYTKRRKKFVVSFSKGGIDLFTAKGSQ